jgi:ABC-type multidrug transport system fused ATPase/permease subunit
LSFVYLLILLNFAKKLKINGNNISYFNHKEASLVRSTLASIVDFIVGGSADTQANIYRSNEIQLRNSYANTLIYAQIPRYIIETVCLGLFTIFIIVSISSNSNLLIFAQLGTLLFAFNRVLPASQQTYAAYAFIKASSKSIENLISVFKLKRKKIFKSTLINKELEINKEFFENKNLNKITINNLAFEYKKNKKIFYSDCQFEEGRPTAIVGKSGSGKTTLVELILRLLVPSNGEIQLNNININQLNPASYYSNISYLSQSPFLFSGSIYENIIFGSNKEIRKNELYEIGVKLGLRNEFGENFLDYQISDFGRNISGGQAQRCSLLKTLSNIKPILILDEPSSALDKNTSMIFNELLLSRSKNSILIVITHSPWLSDLFPSIIDLSI